MNSHTSKSEEHVSERAVVDENNWSVECGAFGESGTGVSWDDADHVLVSILQENREDSTVNKVNQLTEQPAAVKTDS
ncbi:hypothetical protein T265_07898 [Opisthorchis viverrini]|uniref:Uncharacterized protein n=1 Tax=Opisthorchis viverrini TaxID=6198 RepID=A0A074ZFK5_OPIVI|nr:hypothetical protein T265_07898 [Opisthorchis viverrini]KER24422.1 hypothetical protein T265_07898 [Opisthorchis viverrini]